MKSPVNPPAINTWRLGSRVADCRVRAVMIQPVAAKVPDWPNDATGNAIASANVAVLSNRFSSMFSPLVFVLTVIESIAPYAIREGWTAAFQRGTGPCRKRER